MPLPEHDERFEVSNDEMKRTLRSLAGDIDSQLPDGWGFGLLLFSYGENGSMFWISSAARTDMIAAMKEWIAKQERTDWTMDTRNLTMYPSMDAAREAGVPEDALSEMQPIGEATWTATSGPFKGRVYRRNHLGQMVRDREAERAHKTSR